MRALLVEQLRLMEMCCRLKYWKLQHHWLNYSLPSAMLAYRNRQALMPMWSQVARCYR